MQTSPKIIDKNSPKPKNTLLKEKGFFVVFYPISMF